MKIRPDMVVHDEVVDSLIEEDFIDADDELVLEELRRNAEALGLDADALVAAAKTSRGPAVRVVSPPEAFPVNPQRERQEAQRRLNERIKSTARVLLNRLDLPPGGQEISSKLLTNMAGVNFVVATRILNQQVKKAVSTARRGDWSTEKLKRAMDLLPEILDTEVRRLKAKQRAHGEEENTGTTKGAS